MSIDFYNKVAKKFGGYGYAANDYSMIPEYPDDNPEVVFKHKLIELAGKDKKALDVGCGDCKFAFEITDNFSEIIGIDNSNELLNVAQSKKDKLKITNVSFFLQDAAKTEFGNESFDVVFCRRGPSYFDEYYRLLKKGGYYIEIGIGEKDTQELKEVFGRGQGFREWDNNKTRLQKDIEEMRRSGFTIVFAQDYFYNEYYKSFDDLDIFLQGVPIFEDYGQKNDKELLKKYAKKFQIAKGIRLPRHRIVFVAQKK